MYYLIVGYLAGSLTAPIVYWVIRSAYIWHQGRQEVTRLHCLKRLGL